MSKRYLTEDQKAFIVQNYLDLGPRRIAKALDVHESTVWAHGNKAGLTKRMSKAAHRLTDAECAFINEACKNPRNNLKTIGHMLNKEFKLDLSYQRFLNARKSALHEGRVNSRYNKEASNNDNSSTRQLSAQSEQIKYRIAGKCHKCGADTGGGKFCNEHLREGFPRDMTSPREGMYFGRY